MSFSGIQSCESSTKILKHSTNYFKQIQSWQKDICALPHFQTWELSSERDYQECEKAGVNSLYPIWIKDLNFLKKVSYPEHWLFVPSGIKCHISCWRNFHIT